ncbi:MAG: magnesium transporter [Phycisphaerae bacterium]|nr:magnesium transporter [Phycisphaerae bacterium]
MVESSGDGEEMFHQLRELLDGSDEEALRTFLVDLHPADVADCLEQVEPEERSRIMFQLPPRKWAEAVALLEEAVRSDVLDELTDDQVSEVLKELPADDIVDVLDELDEAVADKVVERLPPEQKAVVEPLRQYDEDTAGGLMNPHYVSVPAEGTVIDAIQEIRRLTAEQAADVYYIYCVGRDGRLEGVVPPMRLVIAPPHVPVRDLLLTDMFTAQAEDDQEEVKNKFEKYDVVALPVVDEEGRMLGVITHDDVLDVAEEEAEEDMYYMAGTGAQEFATASIFRAAGVRAKWLLPCLLGTFVSVTIIMFLKPQLHRDVFNIVVVFLSPIAAMGGNAGVQISTVIVRALATDDPLVHSLGTAIARELRIVVLIAIAAGSVASLGTLSILHLEFLPSEHGPASVCLGVHLGRIALAVAASMTIAIVLSGLLAMTLPFVFRRLGIDPAIATGPLITTANDAVSACVYLLLAIALLG